MNTKQLKTLIKSVIKESRLHEAPDNEDDDVGETGWTSDVTENFLNALRVAVTEAVSSQITKAFALEIAKNTVDTLEYDLGVPLIYVHEDGELTDEEFSADWSGVEEVLMTAIKKDLLPVLVAQLRAIVPLSKE